MGASARPCLVLGRVRSRLATRGSIVDSSREQTVDTRTRREGLALAKPPLTYYYTVGLGRFELPTS